MVFECDRRPVRPEHHRSPPIGRQHQPELDRQRPDAPAVQHHAPERPHRDLPLQLPQLAPSRYHAARSGRDQPEPSRALLLLQRQGPVLLLRWVGARDGRGRQPDQHAGPSAGRRALSDQSEGTVGQLLPVFQGSRAADPGTGKRHGAAPHGARAAPPQVWHRRRLDPLPGERHAQSVPGPAERRRAFPAGELLRQSEIPAAERRVRFLRPGSVVDFRPRAGRGRDPARLGRDPAPPRGFAATVSHVGTQLPAGHEALGWRRAVL